MAGNLKGREARKMLADARAVEEEAERANPVRGRGKKLLGAVKGAGATPSMGLSQFRGGAAPFTDEAFDMMAMMPSGEYDGAGKMLGSKGHGVRKGGKRAPSPVSSVSSMEGGAETGAYRGEGLSGGGHIVGAGAGAAAAPKAKRVISADDPRRRRAQLVGKVMKERGVSLAEASKIVKAEGLSY